MKTISLELNVPLSLTVDYANGIILEHPGICYIMNEELRIFAFNNLLHAKIDRRLCTNLMSLLML